MRRFIFIIPFLLSLASTALSDTKVTTKIGVATVLTGDAAIIGTNIEKTVGTYKKRHLRHPLEFVFEDAKKSSVDGLHAYRRLIEIEKVDVLIGGTTSNGTLAGAPIVNQSKTVLITPLTGGSNIDKAGPYIFRIGNSDILNGRQQADVFLSKGLKRVALVTEQTEYTTDIAKFFKERFAKQGGTIVAEEDFLPDTTDFRSLILRLRAGAPQAIFMSTQTGLAFGLFIKQFRQQRADQGIEIHTNFLSAGNPDAFEAAGESIYGVHYLAPYYDKDNRRLLRFFNEFRDDHGASPAIEFHTAGTVDALDMLQAYLDTVHKFEREGFKNYLLQQIRGYQGLMGTYSFDAEGNADIGFAPAIIAK